MAKRNFLSVTAQKFAAKKLALRRSILRRLAARRMAKRAAGLGLALFMLCGCSIGQLTTLYNEDTSFVENGIRYDAAHQPITGVYHKYADNMQLREEIHYVNGLADGLYRLAVTSQCTTKPTPLKKPVRRVVDNIWLRVGEEPAEEEPAEEAGAEG